MARSTKPARFDAKDFFEGIQDLLGALPSESQKQEINNAFTELINFLRDLQNIFQVIPSAEEQAQLGQLLPKLEEFYASVEKVPLIAASVGARSESSKRASGPKPAKREGIDAKRVLAGLTNLPADEIRFRLESRTYSKPDLQNLAAELGIKPDSKDSKIGMADKIANAIENQRMRDSLAGRSNREAAGD
jgi:hypothetical protein